MFKLFIKRPILSGVISVIIVCLGVLSILTLPITQFPDIVPPSVTVTARYTGASADVMSKTVATPLERAINGVPGMTYMTTVCTNDGMSLTTIYFKVGTDPDVAAVNVQNRVTTVLDELPEEVIRAGVKTKVLMLSATPVNNRFVDLKNQLALAYEGSSEYLDEKLNTSKSIEDIFKQAQKAFNAWSKLKPEERTTDALLRTLDFDFFELLDSVTIARSRKHIEKSVSYTHLTLPTIA